MDQANQLLIIDSIKYKLFASQTKASFCITTEKLKKFLPDNVQKIVVKNVLYELAKILKNVPSKINLIPFNPFAGSAYKRPSSMRVQAFKKIMQKEGFITTVRTTRGEDIMAACGQLKSATERARKSRKEIAAETGL